MENPLLRKVYVSFHAILLAYANIQLCGMSLEEVSDALTFWIVPALLYLLINIMVVPSILCP